MFAWGTGGNSNRRRRRYIALGGNEDEPRVTQRLMDEFLVKVVAQDENNQNPLVQAYRNLNEAQQRAFSQGEELGENNEEDPTVPRNNDEHNDATVTF